MRDRCEHYGWKIVVMKMSFIAGEYSHNYLLMKCGGCGDFRCLDFQPGEFL